MFGVRCLMFDVASIDHSKRRTPNAECPMSKSEFLNFC
jgi:hypothetical protein